MQHSALTDRPTASLSLDLDNQWAYLRAAGRANWQQADSFLDVAVDRLVKILIDCGLPLTVFVVGRDLERSADVQTIERFGQLRRWELANHSYHHQPWLHRLDRNQIEQEIDRTAAGLQRCFGQRPVGFRGPGFSCPETVLSVLADRGYRYDASIFPTSLAPVARAYYLLKTGVRGEPRAKAAKMYGGWSSALQPNRPFRRHVQRRRLWEVPVTVMPLARTPIHFSYLTYLAGFSALAAKAYFRQALALCRATATPPSLLLHPPDMLGREDACQLDFFPSMNMPRNEKLHIVRWALSLLADSFDVQLLAEQVDALESSVASTRPEAAIAEVRP